MSAAYSFSIRSAVEQSTVPLVTLTTTGTLAPVRVVPHGVPAGVAPAEALAWPDAPDAAEHPASKLSKKIPAMSSGRRIVTEEL